MFIEVCMSILVICEVIHVIFDGVALALGLLQYNETDEVIEPITEEMRTRMYS